MKVFQKLTNERFARPAARFMQLACYFAIGFFILCTALSFMGRQTFSLHTQTGSFDQAIYAVTTVPIMLAYWFLSRLVANIHRGQIFTEQNASCLLWYGLLQFFTALLVPFIKLLICWLTNLVAEGRVSIGTGQSMLSTLVPSIAFIVAAYIIHYGVGLQDEVDHTL